MFIRCSGKGSPTVVLEAGAGLHSGDWQKVQPKVDHFTHVCSYDRAGLGRSDDLPEGGEAMSGGGIVEQLHTLLEKAKVEPPFVLVGHSMGGLYVRLYHDSHPEDTVGMVLVDSVSGEYASLGDKPLVVLTQSMSGLPRGSADSWVKDHVRMAELSSRSVLVEAEHSSHFIEQDQPEIIVEAIRQVVEAVRNDSELPPCEETFPKVDGDCLAR